MGGKFVYHEVYTFHFEGSAPHDLYPTFEKSFP